MNRRGGPIQKGQKYYYHHYEKNPVQVMEVAEDFAMVRYPRSFPFVVDCAKLFAAHQSHPNNKHDDGPKAPPFSPREEDGGKARCPKCGAAVETYPRHSVNEIRDGRYCRVSFLPCLACKATFDDRVENFW